MNIEKYLGIPFKKKGRGFDGCDCYGLVWLFYRNELGIELPDYRMVDSDSTDAQLNAAFLENAYRDWAPIEFEDRRPYDGIMLNTGCGDIRHCGIVISDDRFLHAWREANQVMPSSILKFKHSFHGLYRHKDLA